MVKTLKEEVEDSVAAAATRRESDAKSSGKYYKRISRVKTPPKRKLDGYLNELQDKIAERGEVWFAALLGDEATLEAQVTERVKMHLDNLLSNTIEDAVLAKNAFSHNQSNIHNKIKRLVDAGVDKALANIDVTTMVQQAVEAQQERIARTICSHIDTAIGKQDYSIADVAKHSVIRLVEAEYKAVEKKLAERKDALDDLKNIT